MYSMTSKDNMKMEVLFKLMGWFRSKNKPRKNHFLLTACGGVLGQDTESQVAPQPPTQGGEFLVA